MFHWWCSDGLDGAVWGGLGWHGRFAQAVSDAAAEEGGEIGVVGGDEDAAGARGIEQIPDACPVAAEFAFAGVDGHSVYFSVSDSEWPEVKKRLEDLMRR